MIKHEFGGEWTTEKLECLEGYLAAYTKIFRNNPKARYYTTTYVDAFAGTGYRSHTTENIQTPLPFMDLDDAEGVAFLKGSARIALEVEPSFDKFLFLEKNPLHAQELESLKIEFSQKVTRIQIEQAEANAFLKEWCRKTDWDKNRAVVFLDPYGMQVDWSLIEAIANTKAIDLWWLFPLGVSIIRMLTKNELPPDEWASTLTRTFGTDTWKDEFYPREKVMTLFGEEDQLCRKVEFENVGQFIINRLKTIFPAVANTPLQLCNSKNNPLYLLCFAAGNPKGGPTAIRIANCLLKGKKKRK